MAVESISAKTWDQKVVKSDLPVVVNFSAARCGFCKALDPLYERLSNLYKDRLTFFKLMADDSANQELLLRSSIEGTPTLKFYCQGREVGEHVGYSIEPKLRSKIDSMLEEMETCLANSTPLGKR